MRRPLAIAALALALPLACARTERGPSTSTTLTQRMPVVGLADSVAGPAPSGVAAQLLPDADASAPPAARRETPAQGYCASALRDPGTGQRFVAMRTQVSTRTTHPGRDTTVHELRGWGDYRPLAPAASGMTAEQALRVDCANYRVGGLAPGASGA